MNDEKSSDLLNQTVINMENAISNQANIDLAHETFVTLLQTEMEDKLKLSRVDSKQTHKRHKSKPYWSDELQVLWCDLCNSENSGCLVNRRLSKKRLREKFCFKRKEFNKMLRKAKRSTNYNSKRSCTRNYLTRRDFWKDIGKLGLANERKSSIPMEILDENAQLKSETFEVLDKWNI